MTCQSLFQPFSRIRAMFRISRLLLKSPCKTPGYPDYLESVSGLFTYYNQERQPLGQFPLWPKDPIRTHGCGPTVLAMLVSSYTGLTLTPDIAASWAADNELCVPGDGSSHDIVETGCSAFGLKARPLPDPTVQNVLDELYSG